MAKRKVKRQNRARKDPLDALVSLPMLALYAAILLIIGTLAMMR